MAAALPFLTASFLSGTSWSGSLFVPANATFPAGIMGGPASLVPVMVFWAKHALVLWVFHPHHRHSAWVSLCFWNSSGSTSFMASAKDAQRISWSGYLSNGGPLLYLPWVFAPFWGGLVFSVSLPFPASFPLSLDREGDGLCLAHFGRATSLSSMKISARITTVRRSFSFEDMVPYLLMIMSNMSFGIMLTRTCLYSSPSSLTRELSSSNLAKKVWMWP